MSVSDTELSSPKHIKNRFLFHGNYDSQIFMDAQPQSEADNTLMHDSIEKLGMRIDEVTDREDPGELAHILKTCEEMLQTATGNDRVLLYYFTANAEAGIRQDKLKNQNYLWSWEQPETIREILALRRAVSEPSFSNINAIRRCQILTNLANSFDHIGRTIDALEHWDAAIKIIPQSAMAQGNRGLGLVYYCKNLYDPGHHGIFLAEAHSAFITCSNPDLI